MKKVKQPVVTALWPEGTPQTYSGFLSVVESRFCHNEVKAIMAAYELSKYGHRNQKRADGERYFDHPRHVAMIAMAELLVVDYRVVVEALLHDIREDSHLLDPWMIERMFDSTVSNDLQLLTKEPKEGYLGRMKMFAGARVLLVKQCDRLHNLRDMGSCTKAHRAKQIAETEMHYAGLINLLRIKLSVNDQWQASYLERNMKQALERWS